MESFATRINDALRMNESVVFSANCSISYSGRAESYLGFGDRLVMIKQDGTLIVHQPSGSSPVNYMKEGTIHSVRMKDGCLLLSSKSPTQKEFMEILMKKVHFINSLALIDKERIMIAGTEKDMSDMIFNNPSIISDDFKPLSREEHTKFGFIDVFGYDGSNTLTVIECKRERADFSAVSQLERYVKRIKESKGIAEVNGIIAAPAISDNAATMLKEKGFTFKTIEPPKFLERYGKAQSRLGDFDG